MSCDFIALMQSLVGLLEQSVWLVLFLYCLWNHCTAWDFCSGWFHFFFLHSFQSLFFIQYCTCCQYSSQNSYCNLTSKCNSIQSLVPWTKTYIKYASLVYSSCSVWKKQHLAHECRWIMILINSPLRASLLTHRLHFFYGIFIFTNKLFN